MTGERADQLDLIEAFHANSTLRSTCSLNHSHPVDFLETTLVALVLTPVIRVPLLEAVLHIRVYLSTVLAIV